MSHAELPELLRDAPKLQALLKTKPESFWIKRGEAMALKLFHDMAERVPAYQDFLQTHGFDPKTVKTITDFSSIPLISKDNYLRKYPLEQLCWDGSFAGKSWVVSSTSGSTGEPFYFPRTDLQDEYYALVAELYLRENFHIHEKTTLYIDAFAMGAWIGGLFTYEAVHKVAQKGYPLTIITPGINKAEVINSVRKLGPHFDQVIIGCYPPIMRDIIDLGIDEGIKWEEFNLGIVFSAEGFSEKFRDYIARHGKIQDIYKGSLNHYGTVDLGTMSHETPLTTLIRRQAMKDQKLAVSVFSQTAKQPTLTQYLPELFYFEAVNGSVVCSSNSGLPLVRYDLNDGGGVLSYAQLAKRYEARGHKLEKDIAQAGIGPSVWNLPFVYVYERRDFSVSLSGALIYPDEVRQALLDPTFEATITGKFTMEIQPNRRMENQLVINVELRKGVAESTNLSKQLQKSITVALLQHNSEYASNYASSGKKMDPKIILWPFEHELHFSGRGKQKWVKK